MFALRRARTISLLIVRRIEALGKFLDTDDGKNLLAGTKRAANILRIEEKKDSTTYTGAPDAALLAQPEESELARAIDVAKEEAAKAVAAEDFAAAMTRDGRSCGPHVDAFFDKVTVNVDDSRPAGQPAQAAERNPRGHPARWRISRRSKAVKFVMPGSLLPGIHAAAYPPVMGEPDRASAVNARPGATS